MTNSNHNFFKTGEVAKLCGVTKVTVIRWIERGNLMAFRLPGGQYRIRREDILSFANNYHIPVKF